MKRIISALICLMFLSQSTLALAASDADFRELKRIVESQQDIIQNQQQTIDILMDKLNRIESSIHSQGRMAAPSQPMSPPQRVSLDDDQMDGSTLIAETQGGDRVLERPWFKNVSIHGHGAAGAIGTGGRGDNQNAGFFNYEAQLMFDAEVWDDVHYVQEVQTQRIGDENTQDIRIQEMHVHFKDFMSTFFDKEGHSLGLKVGRLDIPFGEDYLTEDIVDNPLISFAAGYPNWVDEGIVLHGKVKGVNWIASAMDGQLQRGFEVNKDKMVSLKIYGEPTENLYLSASGMRNGEATRSALRLGGRMILPVGAGGFSSSLGTSPSSVVDIWAAEADAKYSFGHDRYVKLQYGFVYVDDDATQFDRDIHYVQVEPKWNLGEALDNKWYLVARFSAIGTFDEDKGYLFDGFPFQSGDSDFGFDTKALYRYSFGVGYKPNPRTVVKLEYSRDDFRLIDATTFDGGSEGRDLYGLVTAVEF